MADDLQLVCAKCGSTLLDQPDEPKPEDVIACAGCGASATVHELATAALLKAPKVGGKGGRPD